MMFFELLLLLLSYPGITSHVDGWPQDLAIHEHIVSAEVITESCGRFALACTKPNLYTGRCDVYLPPWAPNWIREHEIEHCRGGDHAALDQLVAAPLHDYFNAWVAADKPRVADPLSDAPCLAVNRNAMVERLPATHQLAAREALIGRSYADIAQATGKTVAASARQLREVCRLPLIPAYREASNDDAMPTAARNDRSG